MNEYFTLDKTSLKNALFYQCMSMHFKLDILTAWIRRRFVDTEVNGSNCANLLCLPASHFIRIASVDSAEN